MTCIHYTQPEAEYCGMKSFAQIAINALKNAATKQMSLIRMANMSSLFMIVHIASIA